MRLRLAASLALLASACTPNPSALPADAVILPGNQAELALDQCSRSSPALGEASWQPEAADIVALEAALPAALAASNLSAIEERLRARPEVGTPNPSDPDWATAPRGWQRQYVGIVRGGRRFIYGNFYPHRPDDDRLMPDWRTAPVRVCDGGPVFFGAEYDVEARRFTHVAFNGAI
jgi:hypothetical protein